MKKLAYVLPLGTLVLLAIAFAFTRWSAPEPAPLPVVAAADAHLPPLAFAARDARIEGRVVDAQGAPVARATLWLRAGAELGFTESDAEGAFRFDRVQAGPRVLGVVADGFEPQRWTLPEGTPLERVVLERRLAPPPALPEMVRSTLRGRVAAGAAAGMQVCLAPRAPPETLGAPLPVRAECAEDGTFVFEDLIEGDYTVELRPRWAANGSWPDLLRPLSGAGPTPLVHAGSGPAEGLQLQPIAARVRGTLRDAYGGPLEGALVFVAPAADAERVWPPVTSGADGAFERADLPPGKYVVRVRAGGDSVQLEVELAASETRELSLRPLDVARTK